MNTAAFTIALILVIIVVPLVSIALRIMTSTRRQRCHKRLEQAAARLNPTYKTLSHVELAFLVGGPKRALIAAVAQAAQGGMHSPHSLTGYLQRRNLHETTSYATISKEAEPYFQQITDRFAQLHLGPSATQFRWIYRPRRIARSIGLGLFIISCVVLIYGHVTGGDIPWSLSPTLTVMGIGFFWTLLWIPISRPKPLHTAHGERIAAAARVDFNYLHPRHEPAYRSYGPWAGPVAAALFGATVLAAAYPDWAALPVVSTITATTAAIASHSGGCGNTSCGTDPSSGCGGSDGSGCSSSCSGGCGGGCGGD